MRKKKIFLTILLLIVLGFNVYIFSAIFGVDLNSIILKDYDNKRNQTIIGENLSKQNNSVNSNLDKEIPNENKTKVSIQNFLENDVINLTFLDDEDEGKDSKSKTKNKENLETDSYNYDIINMTLEKAQELLLKQNPDLSSGEVEWLINRSKLELENKSFIDINLALYLEERETYKPKFKTLSITTMTMNGSGTSNNPYKITSCQELQDMKEDINAHYILDNDIDCSETISWNNGKGFKPIWGDSGEKFAGNFDGKSYTISNLYINRGDENYVGLFGFTGISNLSNIILKNLTFTGKQRNGFLSGKTSGTKIENISIKSGKIRGLNILGGITGENTGNTQIKNCKVKGDIGSGGSNGGIIGNTISGSINQCSFKGNISGNLWNGGLIGKGQSNTINKSYANTNIDSLYYTGGLVGELLFGRIENSYFRGKIKAASGIGGLVGQDISNSRLSGSYAEYNISYTSRVGGIISGYNSHGLKIGKLKSYWDIETTKLTYSKIGTGKTTSQMKTQSTYEDWDFDNIWIIDSTINNGYPQLRWDLTKEQKGICSGTLQVITENKNNEPINNLQVYVDEVKKTQTDEIGQATINIADTSCSQNLQVEVRCSNDIKVCGTKSTTIDYENDFESLMFDCSICQDSKDIYLRQEDIELDIDSNIVTLNPQINGDVGNYNIVLVRETKEGIGSIEGEKIVGGSEVATFNLNNLEIGDYIRVSIDTEDEIEEMNEKNNYIVKPVMKEVKIYLDIRIDPAFSILEEPIREYLKGFTTIVDHEDDAEITVKIGNPMFFNLVPFRGRKVYNAKLTKPYTGIVKREYIPPTNYFSNPKSIVYAYGNRIEGTIAAVKRLVSARHLFLGDPTIYNINEISYIDDLDRLGISTYDLMHTKEVHPHFGKNNEALKIAVEKILNDNNFEVAVKKVKTLKSTSYGRETMLRLKNVNSDYSDKFIDAIGVSDIPVVLGHGLYGDLNRLNSLGEKLVREGFNTWQIELTGGPTIDCSECPNYEYEDLVDYYWPALIGGVIGYTGENKIKYVGHSNGCRVALSSLNEYSQTGKSLAGYYFVDETGEWKESSLSPEFVATFVGVGCPVNLNDGNFLVRNWFNKINEETGEKYGDYAIRKLEEENKTHVDKGDLNEHVRNFIPNWLGNFNSWIFGESKISRNLQDFYNTLYTRDTSMDISDINLNNLFLFISEKDDDGAVPKSDGQYLYTNLYSNNKKELLEEEKFDNNPYTSEHSELIKNKDKQNKITEVLK